MVERIRILLESRQLTPTQFADLIGIARPIVSHVLSGRNKPSLEVVQRILAAMPELAMPWLLNGSGPMLAPSAAAGAAVVLAASASAPVAAGAADAPVAARVVAHVAEAFNLPQYSDKEGAATETQHAAATPVNPASATQPTKLAEPVGRVSKPLPFRSGTAKAVATPKRFVAPAAGAGKTGSLNEPAALLQAGQEEVAAGVAAPVFQTAPTAPTAAPMAVAHHLPVQPSVAAEGPPVAGTEGPENALAHALFTGAEKQIRRIVIFYHDGSFADYQPE